MPFSVEPMPKLAEVERAMETLDAGAGGPRTRTILRLLLRGARPTEVSSVRPADLDLPASAVLRSRPGLKVTVAVARKGAARPSLRIRLEGADAQDAKHVWQAAARTGEPLFPAAAVREARKALGAALGRPVSARTLRLVAILGLCEKVWLRMTPSDRPS